MPRGRSDRGGFLPVGINAPSCRGVYRVPLFHLSVGMCVRVCDIEFVVFTDCDSCTRPISTNPVSAEAGECGLARERWLSARRLDEVAFAGLLRLPWCVLGGVDFFVLSMGLHFKFFPRSRAASVELVKGLRQPADLPTENSRPPIPTRYTV